jgi:hypothetical protein
MSRSSCRSTQWRSCAPVVLAALFAVIVACPADSSGQQPDVAPTFFPTVLETEASAVRPHEASQRQDPNSGQSAYAERDSHAKRPSDQQRLIMLIIMRGLYGRFPFAVTR